MRAALVAGAAVVIAVALAAPALSEGITQSNPTVNSDPCAYHSHPAREQRHLAKRSFRLNRWHDATPARKVELKRMRLLRSCAPNHALPAMRKSWRAAKRPFYRWRVLRRIAPYPGYVGYGMGLRYLAVPRAIVDCEGGPDWNRPNSSGSGAYGPYQLLGHGEPIPVNSYHDQMTTHRIARELYVSSGTSPWAASSGCWG